MALEDDPLMVSCLSPKLEAADRKTRKSHQEFDWSMQIKIDGFEGFGDLPPDQFAELIRSRVKESARAGFRNMRGPETIPQLHLEEDSSFQYDMDTERLTQFENDANPFIGIFHLKGRGSIDAKLPVSADEGMAILQRKLVDDISNRIASLAKEDTDE